MPSVQASLREGVLSSSVVDVESDSLSEALLECLLTSSSKLETTAVLARLVL